MMAVTTGPHPGGASSRGIIPGTGGTSPRGRLERYPALYSKGQTRPKGDR